MIFEKLADFVIKHAKIIIIAWVLILLASAYPAINVSDKFSYETSSMGSSDSESLQGMELMSESFISIVDSESMQTLLVTYDSSSVDSATAAAMDAIFLEKLTAYEKVQSVIDQSDPVNTPGVLVYAIVYLDEYDFNDISDDTDELRGVVKDAVAAVKEAGYDTSSLETYVSGSPAISYDTAESSEKDIAIIDPISIFLVIVLVGLFFRSFVSSAGPPAIIGCAFAVTMCLLYFIASFMEIFYITQVLLIVSMLGAGCDYCIFILSRYREERRSGKDHIPACHEAITWAGESVATSGAAVMIGFGSMSICSVSMVSSMGIGLALGILIAIFAALTFMSSLLVLVGDKLFWPSGAAGPKLQKGYIARFGKLAHRYFTISTRFSIKHAKAIVIAAILFTVPMFYVYQTAEDSYDMIGSLMDGESADGMTVMEEYMGGGAIMPTYAIIETEDSMGTVTYVDKDEGVLLFEPNFVTLATYSTALASLDAEVTAMDNVSGVSYYQITSWDALMDPLIALGVLTDSTPIWGETGAFVILKTIPNFASFGTMIDMLLLREDVIKEAFTEAGVSTDWTVKDDNVVKLMNGIIYVNAGSLGVSDNGDGTADAVYIKYTMTTTDMAMSDKSIGTVSDFTDVVHDYVDGSDYFAAVTVTGSTAVMVDISEMMNKEFIKIELLAVVLIIILLFFVMKSYLTPIRSVVTILMSVIWTVAITHLLFGDLLGQGVMWLIPIILLVICLGLGMDYDILLTTRIREYHMSKGMSNDDAISDAVLHSGSVITICGFIMAGTFGSMMLASSAMLQQMGFALAFAILVDALVVRTYIVPAAMHLMGEWNWKGPKFLHKGLGGSAQGVQQEEPESPAADSAETQ